jgi:hypothetical protein
MNLFKCLIGGLIGGIFGTAVWAAIAYFAHAEVGWIAWGIGFVVGFGVRLMASEDQGLLPGIIAVGIAVVSVLAGKYLAVEMSFREFAGEIDQMTQVSETDMLVELSDGIVGEWQQQGKAVVFPAGMTIDEADEPHEYPAGVWDEAKNRWTALGAVEQKKRMDDKATLNRELAGALQGAIKRQGFLASFSPYDFLWFFLAAATAFRIGSGGGGDDD